MARKPKIKRLRGAKWEPKIKHRPERNCWMVDCGYAFGKDKRLRRMFPTEAEAQEWAAVKKNEYSAQLTERREDEKVGAVVRLASLTDTQRNHIIAALGMVGNDTAAILRAIDFYKRHATTSEATRKLNDVFTEYMAGKEASGKRPRTIRDARGKLTPFVEAHKDVGVHAVTTADVEAWLSSRGYGPETRNAYRVALVGLFNHAVRRRYIDHNPAAVIERTSTDQGLPAIHKLDEVRRMLAKARDFIPSRLDDEGKAVPETNPQRIHEARAKVVPYLAIGYFAGLRPENELVNLDWKDIDFEARTIRVDPATAKKRRQRYVDMSENLIAWLTPYVQKSGRIGFSRRIFRKVREAAKVQWPKDVMRHSFGSYLLAHNEDAAKTALQMGHSRTDVLFNHYRNLVKKTAAAEYWAIVPHPKGSVVQLPIARAG